jgi:hypothetical protein
MVNAKILPSNERIKEYLLDAVLRKDVVSQKNKILNCLAGILRMEEDHILSTNAQLK